MFDSIIFSLKGLSRKRLRSILVVLLVCVGVFLLNVYAMMTGCIVEMEQIKAHDNIEYKRITILPYDSETAEKCGIRLYDLYDLKEIPNVVSVSLNNTSFESNNTYGLFIDTISINGICFDQYYNMIDGTEYDFPVYPIYDAFDPYNIAQELWIQKTAPDYSALLYGEWPSTSEKNEIALDSLTAARFFSLEYEENVDYSSVCGSELVVRTKDGTEVVCNITGIYDYRLYFGYEITKTIEQIESEQAVERFRYTTDELKNNSFTAIDICYPIMINETLASRIYIQDDAGMSFRLPVFEKFYGTIDVMVDSIDNVENVTDLLENYGYQISSQIDLAQNAVQKFFFYKEAILLIGIVISVITILQLINVMVMIVNERKKYMIMLSRIGFRDINVAHIITGEMMWIGLIGSILGLFGCFFSKFVFESQIEHALAQSELHRFINLDITWSMVFVTFATCIIICYLIGTITSILILKEQKD